MSRLWSYRQVGGEWSWASQGLLKTPICCLSRDVRPLLRVVSTQHVNVLAMDHLLLQVREFGTAFQSV